MERADLARLLGASSASAAAGGGPVVVAEREPAKFMAALARALAGSGSVFLADPEWGKNERAGLDECVAHAAGQSERGYLMIPTGGSGGRIKFARHDADSLTAAVQGFCAHFGVSRVDAVGVLPLHHVSGLMAWLRSALTGGSYLAWDWKRLEGGALPPTTGGFISLVPTQLQRLLLSPAATAWLRDRAAVFVGGGPIWPSLAAAAQAARLPVSLGYGMTETAAMVSALLPAEFLGGARSCGRPMPQARIEIDAAGAIRISGASLFRGYFPVLDEAGAFTTQDAGHFDAQGQLHVDGRRDAAIITGGEKVDPAEVENVLRESGEFADVAVIGLPDAGWGEAVTACYPAGSAEPDLAKVKAALQTLAAFKHPRRYAAIADWPRNAQGKINRAELARLMG